MRTVLMVFALLCLSITIAHAQEIDFGRLTVSPVLAPNVKELDSDMAGALVAKMDRVLTHNSLNVGQEGSTRFVLAASVILESKDVSSSVPAMYSIRLSINLSFGDGVDGALFNTINLYASGLERSDKKAYLAAVRSINPNSSELKAFLESSKEKVSTYYSKRCNNLLSEATSLGKQLRYDEALFKLQEVPTLSQLCFEEARNLGEKLYIEKMEFECTQILSQINAAATAGNYDNVTLLLDVLSQTNNCYQVNKAAILDIQNMVCEHYLSRARQSWTIHDYKATLEFLAKVPAGSRCNSEILTLTKEVSTWYAKLEKRELDLQVYRYNQDQARKKELIKAMRDVGVAYGKGQPRVVIKRSWF